MLHGLQFLVLTYTKARRKAILDRLRSWNAFSNSRPVEGIEVAIRTFWQADRRISLYVFGDEFTGDSIDRVLKTVGRLNRPDRTGERKVRIHGIGFPTIFSQARYGENIGVRFAPVEWRREPSVPPRQPSPWMKPPIVYRFVIASLSSERYEDVEGLPVA